MPSNRIFRVAIAERCSCFDLGNDSFGWRGFRLESGIVAPYQGSRHMLRGARVQSTTAGLSEYFSMCGYHQRK